MLNTHKFLLPMFCALLAVGCASTPAAPAVTPTPDACRPSEIQETGAGFPEIRGDMHSDGNLWALLFFGQAHAGQELKIVWKISGGEGTPAFRAAQDDGTTADPVWGPQFHESSTWERPGDEWGTAFILPQAGCWRVIVTRGDMAGEIRLNVFEPLPQ